VLDRKQLAELVSRDLAETLLRYRNRAADMQIGENKRRIAAQQIPKLEAALQIRKQWTKGL